MENLKTNLIMIEIEGLRSLKDIVVALKTQIIQLENKIEEIKLKGLEGTKTY